MPVLCSAPAAPKPDVRERCMETCLRRQEAYAEALERRQHHQERRRAMFAQEEQSEIPTAVLDEWHAWRARKRAARQMPDDGGVPAAERDGYAQRLATWADALTELNRPLKPPKPELRHLSEASVQQRTSAYAEALHLWEASHQRWRIANGRRKAQARAVRDANRRIRRSVQSTHRSDISPCTLSE